jgi:hypothetical protein
MDTGRPSKEQLEKYFKDSRKYFDDIAKHYKEVDKEYYDKYIEPFYSSPFGAVSSGSAKKAVSAIALAGALLVVGIGAAVFYLTMDSTNENKVVQEKSTSVEQDSDFVYKTNFEKGMYFYERENYKSAKKYFMRIEESDSDFKRSQKYLEKIKMKEKKNNMDDKGSDDGSAKQQKLENPG